MSRPNSWPIVLLFAAAVVVPLGVFAFSAVLAQQLLHAQAERRTQRSVDLMREHAVRVFDLYGLMLGQVERRTVGRTWDQLI